MAYNLESLLKIIKQIIHPDHRHRSTLYPNKKTEIDSLLKKVRALKQLLGNSLPLSVHRMESLESRVRDAVYEAEDIIESHLVDPIHSVGEGDSLQKVIGEFDSVEEEIKKIIDGGHVPDSSSTSVVSWRNDPSPKKILVGLKEDSVILKDRLTGQEAKLEIIPIVGMGGIGKTTLARDVYDDALIVSHFDTRAWVTISQDYNVQVILLGLLECVTGKLTDEMRQEENRELALHLHKGLCGRRYLIVLDDMWDNNSWDDIRRFFPNDKNGSRIIVTTREMSVANHAGSNSSHHQMHLLNEEDSWDLFHEKVFARQTCPPELVTIGKNIAENCKGLPLAIHVIGGLLSQAKKSQEYWEQVAKDVSSVVAKNDEQVSKVLSLSYNHLPNHLKPCFLYMSAFPEDYKIRASKLIRLWVAEGFLQPITDKSLEEAAEMYLEALVDRNLIQRETNGIVKSYGMHDLLRDLCVGKACQEKFLYVMNGQPHNLPGDTLSLRRVSAHSPCLTTDTYDSKRLMRPARSVFYFGSASRAIWSLVFPRLLLLRVLDVLELELYHFPKEILQLVNLRYLAFACRSSLPSSLSTLWNLQIIIFRQNSYSRTYEAAHEIFDMPNLRHIKFLKAYPRFFLPERKSFALKENLQTLSCIAVDPGFDRIIESIPNLKKLGIFCFYDVDFFIDLACLGELETLKCSCGFPSNFLSRLIFPPSLKKLTLQGCAIPLVCMNEMGSLPNLEVLKLRRSVLKGSTWEPTEGEFSRLQFLLVESMNLIKWEADETHFRRLQHLVIRDCFNLEEIPSGVGEISTLERIEVHRCSLSAVASARKIQEEQLELGNYGLQVLISGSSQ